MKKTCYKFLKIFPFFCLFMVDIGIKHFTYYHIPKMSWLFPTYPYGGIAVFENFCNVSFSINHVENLGAAWGFFSSFPKLLFSLRIFLVLSLIIFILFFHKEKKHTFAFLLILTGAIGNIYDKIFYGYVIDMFHVTFGSWSFPIFNFADCMISMGIFYLLIRSFKLRKKETSCVSKS